MTQPNTDVRAPGVDDQWATIEAAVMRLPITPELLASVNHQLILGGVAPEVAGERIANLIDKIWSEK